MDEYADVLRIDEVEELESGEEQDVCLSLGVANEAQLSLDVDAVAEEEKGFCIEEEHFEFQKCPSPIKLSPAGKNPAVFQSLEHMRLFKKIDSSAESSSINVGDFEEDPPIVATGTYDVGSIAHMEVPDLNILESIKSNKLKSRRNSDELALDCIMDCSNDFSRTIVEQIHGDKRSLLDMVNELDLEGDL